MAPRKKAAAIPDNSLGDMLAQARKRSAMTLEDVASHLGLKSGQSIWDWENGKGSGVPADTLARLVDLYRIPAETAYEHLLRFHQNRLETKIRLKFDRARESLGKSRRSSRK